MAWCSKNSAKHPSMHSHTCENFVDKIRRCKKLIDKLVDILTTLCPHFAPYRESVSIIRTMLWQAKLSGRRIPIYLLLLFSK